MALSEDQIEDLYAKLESLSKSLEGSGFIDEYDTPDAYGTILDAMNLARAAQQDEALIRQMLEALGGVVTQIKYHKPVTAAITAARARLVQHKRTTP